MSGLVNERVPPQVEQVPQGGQDRQGVLVLQGQKVPILCQGYEVLMVSLDMTNWEIRDPLFTLAGAMTAQVYSDFGPRVNALQSTMTSRLMEYMRMNPPIFLVLLWGKTPKIFVDSVYNVLRSLEVTSREKAELSSQQLKEVSQVWYTQCKNNRPVDSGPILWEKLKEAFFGNYFPHERREVKVKQFIKHWQVDIRVEEYLIYCLGMLHPCCLTIQMR